MKKILSIILALLIAAGAFTVPVYASQENPAPVQNTGDEYDGYPFILVRGMDLDLLMYKEGTPEEENAFRGVEAGPLIKALLKAVFDGLVHWNIDNFADDVIEYVDDILGLVACNKDGTSTYDVSVKEYPLALSNYPDFVENLPEHNEMGILKTACEMYGRENVYYFSYDWRLDPFMNAGKLNEMIERALADTGKAKINIVCASMGGIVTESYIYKYGTGSVNKVLFLSSTFCGTYVTTDLFQGKAVIEPLPLYNFAMKRLGGDKALLGLIYKSLNAVKAFDVISSLGNKLISKIKDKVYEDFLTPVFGTMPALWALCLPDGYDADIEYMFGGKEEEYADFIELTKEYQKMANERSNFLKEEDDFFIDVIASYDGANIPVYQRAGENGDGTLESALMLGFATVAPLGKTLGEDYVAKNPERLSPDRIVDLSDVIFPENTWAISGSPHVACAYGTDYSDFVFWILNTEGRITVNSNPDYPQFMKSSSEMELSLYK